MEIEGATVCALVYIMFDQTVHLESRMGSGNLSGSHRSNISLGKIHLSI